MKCKIILILIFFSVENSYSQLVYSVKVSPSYSMNSAGYISNPAIGISISNSQVNYSNNGSGFRGSISGGIEYFVTDKFSISSGIGFIQKKIGIKVKSILYNYEETYNMNYLQIPLLVNFYSNYNEKQKRFYFQTGSTFDFKLNEENDKVNLNNKLSLAGASKYLKVNAFSCFDITLMTGVGFEKKINNRVLFFGLSYYHGLHNIINNEVYYPQNTFKLGNDFINPYLTDYISIKTSNVFIDMGIKF